MNILHYSLGLPPYRSGGLTKYATDLMLAQSHNGDFVSLLYPGDYTFWKLSKTRITKKDTLQNLSIYEIENPPIVPLLHGVKNPSAILRVRNKISKQGLELFYKKVKPEVFHIHTWMGLPLEVIKYLKEKGTKIIFTSHDYYGLCLKVNFINQDSEVCNSPGGFQCAVCNRDAPISLFLRLRNSKYLLKHKTKLSTKGIKFNTDIKKESNRKTNPQLSQINEYNDLIVFYRKLIDLVDCFHFNSTVSKVTYEQHLNLNQYVVLPISHADIRDNRKIKKIDKKHIRLAYIGATSMYKGFPLLKEVLCKLKKNGIHNWSLQVWGAGIGVDKDYNNIIYKGTYSQEDLGSVYEVINVLIVPSICKETFSLITLEALSHGVPVLVSENVGAKDIVSTYSDDFIFQASNNSLESKLRAILINPLILTEYNKKICGNNFEFFLIDHQKKVKQIYEGCLTNLSKSRQSRYNR